MKVIIVGCGLSGICMAIQLKKKNIHDFIIIEKNKDLGGTWYENIYPGVECDVESHLYSFSFELKNDWDYIFSKGCDIHKYLTYCADKYNVYKHVYFDEVVIEAEFHSWMWSVKTNKSNYVCKYLVCSAAPLNKPSFPDINLSSFRGKIMHTALWDKEYSVQGKRVGVIGNAASGVQIITELSKVVDQLVVFQRTPNWVLPKCNRKYTYLEKYLFKNSTILNSYRNLIYWYREFIFLTFFKNSLVARILETFSICYLSYKIKDKKLVQSLIPKYPIGCKRVLLSDDYYDCFSSNKVNLVTEKIVSTYSKGIITEQNRFELDCLILATGFDLTNFCFGMKIYGKSGSPLKCFQSYYGVHYQDFPNLFFLLGANTGSGHTSIIYYVECQVEHIIKCILTDQQIEVKKDVIQQYNDNLQKEMKRFSWNQCFSWYQKDGKNVALFPGFSFQFKMLSPKLEDFILH